MIADHIRACAFLIVDGVIPATKAAATCCAGSSAAPSATATSSGQKQPFFYKLVADLVAEMGDAYPELAQREGRASPHVLKQEEERFAETLENGMAILEAALAKNAKRLDGETAFKLYDTFGFPVDLTADIGRERGFEIDMAGFDAAMAAQRERARAASQVQDRARSSSTSGAKTMFRGYETLVGGRARRRALPRTARRSKSLAAGEEGIVVLDQHAVLRRVRRPGRRSRRAHQGRHVPHALRGAGHAEDPARRLRPPRRA